MVFEAVLFKAQRAIILIIKSSDGDFTEMGPPRPNGEGGMSRVYYKQEVHNPHIGTNQFYIRRTNHIELSLDGVFLPGFNDYPRGGPWTMGRQFTTAVQADSWIEQFKTAYQTVNGVDLRVIDIMSSLDELPYEVLEA